MAQVIAQNGAVVTEQMIAGWCKALDADKWPQGWRNVGNPVNGKPPIQGGATRLPAASAQRNIQAS